MKEVPLSTTEKQFVVQAVKEGQVFNVQVFFHSYLLTSVLLLIF